MSAAAVAKVGLGIHAGVNVAKDNCPDKWIQIPDVKAVCVEEVARTAVQEYNLEYKESFKFKSVVIGWYSELKESNLKYRLNVVVTDCLGREFKCEAVMKEKKDCSGKVRELESFKLIGKN